MASFPSPGLPRELLEQIATKCEGKAYLRLQQTCRLMNELVQTRRNIRVFLKRGCKLKRAVLDNGTSQVQLFKNDNIQMDPKSLYGIRIHSIELPMEMTDEEIEELCDTLKQSRFTATLIYLQSINFYKKSMLTKEQCTRLFETLKPTRFSIDSKESNRFEAILSSNIQDMEDVSLQVDAVIASSAAIRLLPRFQNVTIHVGFLSFREEEEIFDCFMAILQFLRWTSLPKLKYFTFSARRASRTPNVQETFQKFSEFNPILVKKERLEYTVKCTLEPCGSSCEIITSCSSTQLFLSN